MKRQVFRTNTVISPLQASEIMRVKMSKCKFNAIKRGNGGVLNVK